jgi:predicted HicB family RNase H-like nuclease
MTKLKDKTKQDPIPKQFKSLEEFQEFWDTNSLADYWDSTREVHFDVDIQRRVFIFAIESNLAERLADYARKQGISVETLINVWLTEKVTEASQRKRAMK